MAPSGAWKSTLNVCVGGIGVQARTVQSPGQLAQVSPASRIPLPQTAPAVLVAVGVLVPWLGVTVGTGLVAVALRVDAAGPLGVGLSDGVPVDVAVAAGTVLVAVALRVDAAGPVGVGL